MDLTLSSILPQIISQPALAITALLVLGVVLVNGWTDAPNAIATCVSTRALSARAAILMAALFNFLGVLIMTILNKSVAQTIYNMVDFTTVKTGGDNPAMTALCAALVGIVVWATAAWYFGIPTSESHALIAGLSGAAIAMGGFDAISLYEWGKVLIGLALSTVLGFASGYGCVKLTELICRPLSRNKTENFFSGAQIFGGAMTAFMHGAQDGQKFIGVFILGMFIAQGKGTSADFTYIPFWLIVVVSLTMGLGTSIGGMRIIKSVGMDMVKLKKYQGFCADVACSACLLLSSLTSIPVSTTHTKTTAIMGVGAARRSSSVNWSVVKEMVYAWVLTFPGCGLVSYILVKISMAVF